MISVLKSPIIQLILFNETLLSYYIEGWIVWSLPAVMLLNQARNTSFHQLYQYYYYLVLCLWQGRWDYPLADVNRCHHVYIIQLQPIKGIWWVVGWLFDLGWQWMDGWMDWWWWEAKQVANENWGNNNNPRECDRDREDILNPPFNLLYHVYR